MYQVSKNNPFPSEMRGDVINGSYCEISINNGMAYRYIIIYPSVCNLERTIIDISGKMIPLEERFPKIRKLGYIPSEDTFWLYTVITYTVDKIFTENQSDIAEHRENFKEYVFDDINKVLDFCKNTFNIGVSNFRKDWETNYPKW